MYPPNLGSLDGPNRGPVARLGLPSVVVVKVTRRRAVISGHVGPLIRPAESAAPAGAAFIVGGFRAASPPSADDGHEGEVINGGGFAPPVLYQGMSTAAAKARLAVNGYDETGTAVGSPITGL